MDEKLPKTLDEAEALLTTAVYEATRVFEDLERAGLLHGNGHQLRQRLALDAVVAVRWRWSGPLNGAVGTREEVWAQWEAGAINRAELVSRLAVLPIGPITDPDIRAEVERLREAIKNRQPLTLEARA